MPVLDQENYRLKTTFRMAHIGIGNLQNNQINFRTKNVHIFGTI